MKKQWGGKSSFRKEHYGMLKSILKNFPAKPWSGRPSPFEALIATILSQATNDRNRDRALENLMRKFKMTPRGIASASLREIVECIKPAGLHRVKGPRIKEVARVIVEKYGGSLTPILRLPKDEARIALMALPGVGFKTADVMLAFAAGHGVLPVDTHIARIARRIGLASSSAGYEDVKNSLEALVPAKQRRSMHLSLIRFGREVCKARKLLCHECPITKQCPSSSTF